VPTADTLRFSYVVEHLLVGRKEVYLTGPAGTGKSVVLSKLLTALQETRAVDSFKFIFSARTSAAVTQLAIEGKLERIKKTLLGSKPGHQAVLFIDDVNMPQVQEYGAQPPIELLRLLIDKHGVYDRKERFWKTVHSTNLLLCSAPPGGGRSPLTMRFSWRFNVLSLPAPTDAILWRIFAQLLGGFLF